MTNAIKFGTDGWRAIIADKFTFENVVYVTKGIAKYITDNYDINKPIIIGYDTRFLADKFANKAAKTLKELGFKVLLSESFAPTPAIAYCAKELNTAGALMFTASHNPPEYCGIKYIPDYAGPATKEITDELVFNINNKIFPETNNNGEIKQFSPKDQYLEELKRIVNLKKISQANININFDPLYATANGYFDKILDDYSCKVNIIHNWRDPLYGGGMPEPKEKYLSELKELVISNYPSVGFSNDGDADRFGVIDEKGNFITPNEIIGILFKHLVKNKNFDGCIVRTVAGSLMLDKLAEKYNKKIIETPVGFKWVGEAMRNNKVIIGGEESGGLSILGHIPEKDGILANLLVLEAMAYENKMLCELVEELKSEIGIEYINNRIDINLNKDIKEKAVNMFMNQPLQEIAEFKVSNISNKDGIKYYLEDNNSWILIRPSGTEPLLRVYVETDSENKLNKIINFMNELMSKL